MQLFSTMPYKHLVCALFVVSAGQALGDPLTFNFNGNVTYVADYLDFDESIYVGAPFSGVYTFDPTGVGDYYPNSSNVGFYGFPAGKMSARIGNFDFVTQDLGILIWNDLLSGDLYEPISTTTFVAAGYQWSGLSLLLEDRTGTALDSDALPTAVPDLADWANYRDLLLERFPGDELGIRGRVTSLTPEPGSLVLLAFGATVVLARTPR